MKKVVISGSGLYAPTETITNEELVDSYNRYVQQYNQAHAKQIMASEIAPLPESSAEFITKASGIKRRHVIDKKNILDINVMKPQLGQRPNETMSFQCEFALPAIREALEKANKSSADIDAVIVSCTNTQRPYPGIAVEIQQALAINGYAYDMRVACSSATFGIQAAYSAIQSNQAQCVLVVTPEVATAQVNFRDRDSHFIFGDAATAMVIETQASSSVAHPYHIVDAKLFTQFSNNIRSNDGFINHVERNNNFSPDRLFTQQGRAVFKEIVPLVPKFITEHLAQHQLQPSHIKRFWLHQANINMNNLIMQKLLGREIDAGEAPIVLDEYANTGSAGSAIAFHLYNNDLQPGDLGIICSFGAGYSIGNIIVKKL